MKTRLAILIACAAVLLNMQQPVSPRAPMVFAEPPAQGTPSVPAPTEEPTKAPYVFPTPIFIPTYADDTPVPRPTPIVPRVTNPSTGEQTYTVQPGDSPWIIAQKVYGDGTQYPVIMAANNLTSATRLRTGTVLIIPPLSGSVQLSVTPMLPNPTPAPPALEPTLVPTIPAPTPRPSPTPSRWMPTSSREAIALGINALSALLVITSILSAIMAYLMFLRVRRLERLASGKRQLRIQK